MMRIVCANTSHVADLDARARGTEFVFRHTKNVGDRVEDARRALAGWRDSLDDWAQLQEVLARADVAVALRDPVLEGQSASVLTQLLSGTPVVVYDHAHYSELPDDAVVKVAPEYT